jgi:hypothetical protein
MSLLQKYAESLVKDQIEVEDSAPADPAIAALANQRIRQVVLLLAENPILAIPVVQFIEAKRAEISLATLKALYTDEQIDAMQKEVGLK